MSKAIVRKFFDALHEGDAKALGSLFADDAVIEYPGGEPMGRVVKGSKNIARFYEGVVKATKSRASSVEGKITNLIASGSSVVVQSALYVVSKRGGVVESPAATFFELSGNQIQSLTIYVASPKGASIGRMDLSGDLGVRDLGELAVAAWVVA